MNVPYHSSGALSRAHYAIVRKVEQASSSHSADQDIFLEIQSIRARLSHPKLQLEGCKECLVILLYCFLSVTPGYLPKDAFDYAFPHAINLAAAGKKVEDKRLGYLFCEEMMSPDNELKVMLVNTLRKDLESENMSHVSLVLDCLISSPSEDVVSVVQSRLFNLLSHNHPNIRRRALLALHSLSAFSPSFKDRIREHTLIMLRDSDESVVKTALIVARNFVSQSPVSQAVNDILKANSPYLHSCRALILSILECLLYLRLTEDNIFTLFDILRKLSSEKVLKSMSKAIILDIFKLLGRFEPALLLRTERSRALSIVQSVRQYLVSDEADDVTFFISCLQNIDASLWAGTDPTYPAILDGLEFERIMRLLDSPEKDLRRKTLTVVNKVDPTILDGQLSLWMNTKYSARERVLFATRALEILSVRHEGDGIAYADKVIELTRRLDEGETAPHVFKEVVEVVLNNVHTSQDPNFFITCAHYFVCNLINPDAILGSTALVIATALATEISENLSVAPSALLSALATRLQSCPSSVQEPCLIAMMRVCAETDEVPSDAVEAVRRLSKTARRSISLRCSQFLYFVQNKSKLVKIVNESSSSALPDFLASLENHSQGHSGSPNVTPQLSRVSSRASVVSASQLRYAAYDPPEVIPRLTKTATDSIHTHFSSMQRTSPDLTQSYTQLPTVSSTSGNLASAANPQRLRMEQVSLRPPTKSTRGNIETPGMDLINLESPHPIASRTHADNLLSSSDIHRNFDIIWNAFEEGSDLRGWCSISVETLLGRLQGEARDQLRIIPATDSPFEGEIKIVMIPKEAQSDAVALRLRESEEDSCLWRLRCANPVVGGYIQTLLNK